MVNYKEKQMICNVGGQKIDLSQPFSDYIAACQALISQKRTDLTEDPGLNQKIILANSPFEIIPNIPATDNKPYKSGIILVHGLFDSPFSMREIAEKISTPETICRSILLPGHGTHPQDLLNINYQSWLDTLAWSVENLKQKAENIYIVGYSTGATLATYYAMQYKTPAGIIMLAPALSIKNPLDKILSNMLINQYLSKLKPWLRKMPEIDYIRYSSIASNAVIQLNRLINQINLNQQPLTCPILMINSLSDEVICPKGAMHFFNQQTHPKNKMLLYGNTETNESNIIIRPAIYPELNIQSISHISIPFSINNLHYGAEGDFSRASKIFKEDCQYGAYNRYEQLIFPRRRDLTFNPDFDFMIEQIQKFIEIV